MDAMLHKRCAKFVYVIPEGLRELMSDISREVIRSQPEYMYTFIADYLDALMITRENARVAARLIDSITTIGAMTVELLERTGMSREEADRMATIIQLAFKKYMAVKQQPVQYATYDEEVEEEQDIVADIFDQYGTFYDQEDTAAEIIQRAFRAFKESHKREKELLTGMIDWRIAARSAIYLYRKSGVTHEEANRAATLIKAAYKGYYTRRVMKRLIEEGRKMYDQVEEEEKPELMEVEYEWSEAEEEESGPTSPSYEYEGEEEVGYEDDSKLKHRTSGDVSEIPEDEMTTTAIAHSVMDSILMTAIPDDGAKASDVTDADEAGAMESQEQDTGGEATETTEGAGGETDVMESTAAEGEAGDKPEGEPQEQKAADDTEGTETTETETETTATPTTEGETTE